MFPCPRVGTLLMWSAGLSALFTGCLDHQPSKTDPGTDLDEESAADTEAETGEDSGAAADESCNGEDDDGDGLVDEGFGDVDADGVADCLDDDCDASEASAAPLSDAHACDPVLVPAADPWNVELLWEVRSDTDCAHTVVGDLDGDGASEIVCSGSELLVLSGLDGTLLWRTDAIVDSGIVVVDLDRDGQLEIVGFSGDSGGVLTALRADGTVWWRSPAAYGSTSGGTAATPMSLDVADVGADGIPDVIGHHGIVQGTDGATGSVLDASADPRGLYERELAVGDLDLDGRLDVAQTWRVYTESGTLAWVVTPGSGWFRITTPVVVEADGDPGGEVMWISETENLLVDSDGSELWRDPLAASANSISQACAGDLDGDGWMDVVYADEDEVLAIDVDGNPLWSAARLDSSEAYVACTAFDFDLDGADEVVIVDEETFSILDGHSGEPRYQDDGWYSGTYGDEERVVDLDGDGSVEILVENPVAASQDQPVYKVYGNVNGDWPPGTSIWPTATWSGTSVLPDGTVPRTADAPWLTTLKWRGQPEWVATGSDLRPAVHASCVASCEGDGAVHLAIHVENLGPYEAEDVPLAVYGLQADGTRTLLATLTFPWIDNSTAAEDQGLRTTTAQALRGLVLVAGDDGTGALGNAECNSTDNELAWALASCP